MKIGKIIVFIALALCISTLIWAMQKQIPYVTGTDPMALQKADEVSENGLLYKADQVPFVNVTGPFKIRLDPSFNGVTIEGDSTFFKYVEVHTDLGPRNYRGTRIRYTGSDKTKAVDSVQTTMIRAADLVISIGVENMQQHSGNLYFSNCESINTIGTLRGERLYIRHHDTKAASYDVDINYVACVPSSSKNFSAETEYVHIEPAFSFEMKGDCERLVVMEVENTVFDSQKLNCDEVYIRDVYASVLRVFASDIFNLRAKCALDYTVLGNPTYQKVNFGGGQRCPES